MTILSRLSPKKIFLMDGLGAGLSAVFLGILLPRFQDQIGMPPKALLFLALVACAFAVFSLSCSAFAKTQSQLLLKIIAVSNLNYCFLTTGLLVRFRESMEPLGWTYFGAELLILAVLITLELKASSTPHES